MLECNSTDSYRLARKVVKLDKECEENYNIVIHSKNYYYGRNRIERTNEG